MGALAPPAPPVPPPMPKARLGLGYGLAKVWLEGTGLGGPARVALALALVPSLVVATACTVYYARLWESFRAWFTYILIPSRTVTPGTYYSALPLGAGSTCLHLICSRARAGNGLATPPASLRIARDSFITPYVPAVAVKSLVA